MDFLIAIFTALSAFGALGAAIAAFLSARATERGAEETRNNTTAQLFSSLLESYATDEMLDSMNSLQEYRKKEGSAFAKKFAKLRISDYGKIKKLDHARRRISHYFNKVYVLYTEGLIDKKMVCGVVNKEQIRFYREVIEPLEAAINEEYDQSRFDTLGGLHGVQKSMEEIQFALEVHKEMN
jgi:hypothetical protein